MCVCAGVCEREHVREIKRKRKTLNPGSICTQVLMVIDWCILAHLHMSKVKSQDTDTFTIF